MVAYAWFKVSYPYDIDWWAAGGSSTGEKSSTNGRLPGHSPPMAGPAEAQCRNAPKIRRHGQKMWKSLQVMRKMRKTHSIVSIYHDHHDDMQGSVYSFLVVYFHICIHICVYVCPFINIRSWTSRRGDKRASSCSICCLKWLYRQHAVQVCFSYIIGVKGPSDLHASKSRCIAAHVFAQASLFCLSPACWVTFLWNPACQNIRPPLLPQSDYLQLFWI